MLPGGSRRLTGTVVIATHNAGKLKEMTELLAPYGVETVSAAALGLPEPDETGWMFAENAALKAHAAAKATGLPAFADDSGLCVDALDGAPGLFTADWAGKPRNFMAAMERVTRELDRRLTFGEMTSEQKHGIPDDGSEGLSHRARAFQHLAAACLNKD